MNRENTIKNELKNLTVGKTGYIAFEHVTRWSEDSYEIGTWGKKTTTFAETHYKLVSRCNVYAGTPVVSK